MTKKTFLGISLVLIAAIFGYYWVQWGTLNNFVTAIDHGDDLFGDLTSFYHPMAQNILSTKLPVAGYYYSSFFALLISPLGRISLIQAKWAWGIMQIIFAGLLGLISEAKLLNLSSTNKLFFILLFLTSFPLLHNFKWGQISVLMTLCILAAMWLYQNEYSILSGILLAFAVSVKYYPIFFIVYPILKKDYRFLVAFGLSTLTFFAVIPSMTLGASEWINFEKAVSEQIIKAKFAGDVNSQYFGHIVLRAFPLEESPFRKKLLSIFMEGIGGLVLLVNGGIIWRMQKEQAKDLLILSTGLLFLSLPFVIQTSWAHYFVYLPFCQASLIQIMQTDELERSHHNLAFGLICLSCATSSIFFFNMFPSWSEYNNAGMLFISNFLSLIVSYQILWNRYKKSADLFSPRSIFNYPLKKLVIKNQMFAGRSARRRIK